MFKGGAPIAGTLTDWCFALCSEAAALARPTACEADAKNPLKFCTTDILNNLCRSARHRSARDFTTLPACLSRDTFRSALPP